MEAGLRVHVVSRVRMGLLLYIVGGLVCHNGIAIAMADVVCGC